MKAYTYRRCHQLVHNGMYKYMNSRIKYNMHLRIFLQNRNSAGNDTNSAKGSHSVCKVVVGLLDEHHVLGLFVSS